MTADAECQLLEAQAKIKGLKCIIHEYRLAWNAAEDQLVEAHKLLSEWTEWWGDGQRGKRDYGAYLDDLIKRTARAVRMEKGHTDANA